ncbi:1-(5-phosphoribosyl)-5-[(5-phosphoribosylamino)methylideneamino] imidazole-4-carboxamide isomerase [Desulfosporosinus hippei DSM 8344]|uniref:1-(5-phosphoribosyl)-5-[(5-phosphoribosylamino)methylideneamino] imidazole-4-carboxamide isomerase n=2 Tax=Desulfosporosinus TaxID=79206 RepID=A0A1G7TPP7_9FIRM|nr:1-(5-phosphoribosyl)-5-[(5-phosphoribosylamino)methylideneamino] imidazole-4-carboxamide isomerase [Desulfosporosinus hippei DSM 8344]
MKMILFPAIDLKEGKAVRLLQGRMEDSTVYADNPVDVAKEFERQGAEYLHMVDLNGAFSGKPMNDETIRNIVRSVSMRIQVGGGIRTMERITELLELGVERVILGTIAVKNPELVAEAANRYGKRVIVGIDAKDGLVAVQGWAETTEMRAVDLGKAMKAVGIQSVVFTDISRDGMLQGPNIESTVQMAMETGLSVIASGGISTLADLSNLQAQVLKGVSIEGAITGKALYSGAFTLKEALAAAAGKANDEKIKDIAQTIVAKDS